MDPGSVPLLPADVPAHEEAEEDPLAVDDGDARDVGTPSRTIRLPGGAAQAPGARQEQDGGHGAVRPPPSEL